MIDHKTPAVPQGLKPGINPDDLIPLRKPVSSRAQWVVGILFLSACLTIAFPFGWFMLPHLRAAMHLRAVGGQVSWSIDPNNWKRGGSTIVTFREHYNPVQGNRVQDFDLAALESLLNVEEVAIIGSSRLTEGCLKHVVDLPNLRFLEINSTELVPIGPPRFRPGDSSLLIISKAKKLRQLTILGSSITDAGLKHLGTMTTLESLDLSGSKITDAGLEHFKSLRNLELLNLDHTEISQKAATAFQRAMPKVRMIEVSGPDSIGTPLYR